MYTTLTLFRITFCCRVFEEYTDVFRGEVGNLPVTYSMKVDPNAKKKAKKRMSPQIGYPMGIHFCICIDPRDLKKAIMPLPIYVHSGGGSSTDVRRYYLLCPQHKKLLLTKSDWMMPYLSTQHPRLLSADSSF